MDRVPPDFGGDQAGARTEKRVIDQLAGPAIVDNRVAHALDRLLRGVPPALLALSIAKRIVVGDLPHGGLLAATLPVARLALAHRIPAGFMAPMVVTPAQGEMRLGPDDLSAHLKPAGDQIAADHVAVQRPVPHISDIPGKQRIGLPPVGAVIVEHLALRELSGTDPMARSPSRVAHSRIPVSLVRASAQHVPFADAVFDTIVMTWTLCSIPNPIAALAETRRVLKPGGRLLFVEHGLSPEIRIARWQR